MGPSQLAAFAALALAATLGVAEVTARNNHDQHKRSPHKHHEHGHHHKHHHHHGHHEKKEEQHSRPKVTAANAIPVISSGAQVSHSEQMVLEKKMKQLEGELATKEMKTRGMLEKGTLAVNGPLPTDFSERFSKAAAKAADCDEKEVRLVDSHPMPGTPGVVQLIIEAPKDVLSSIENQASDPDSKLAGGVLHSFLVERESTTETDSDDSVAPAPAPSGTTPCPPSDVEDTKYTERGIDIDTAMPYGDLEPFGREDTAQELTEDSIKQSDMMVDQLERAEVAEEKRAVFRALTRLRGAAITSFDGVARSQTGNVDEYNKVHKWRSTHPLHHLADEESDITKWAFPDNADF